MALQREDRDVRRDDDEHGKERRPADFHGGIQDLLQAGRAVVRSFRELAEHVFDHDHRAVDDDPEIHRTQGQQVRGNPHPAEAYERGKQGQRDHQRDDERGPQVAQEQQQHQRHQRGAFEEVGEHRSQRPVDQPGAVVEGRDRHPARQPRRIQRPDLFLQGLQHLRRVLALSHQHDAGDDVVVVVLPHDPLSRDRAHAHVCQVLDQDRHAAALGDHDAADLVGRAQQPDASDEILLPALLEVAPADVGVAALQRRKQLLQSHLVVAQLS